MRNTKAIEPSLKKKIKQNDDKLRILYGKELKTSNPKKANTGQILRNKSNQKTQNQKKNPEDSSSEIILHTYNDNNEPSPETEEINSKISKRTIETEREKNEPSAFVSRMQKRMKFKNDKEEKKNNTMFYNTFANV